MRSPLSSRAQDARRRPSIRSRLRARWRDGKRPATRASLRPKIFGSTSTATRSSTFRPAWSPRRPPTTSIRASWRRWSTCTRWAIPAGTQKILENGQSSDAKTVSLGDAGHCLCAERDLSQRPVPGSHRCIRIFTVSAAGADRSGAGRGSETLEDAAVDRPQEKARETMKSRREFLKDATASAVLLGSSAVAEKLALAAAVVDSHAANGKSKVVIARDATLHGASAQPDEQKVLNLLDKAMAAYTGREKPVEAWKKIVPADVLDGKVIGLKVNGLGEQRNRNAYRTDHWPLPSGCNRPASSPATFWSGTRTPTSSRPVDLRSRPIQAASAATLPTPPVSKTRSRRGAWRAFALQDPYSRVRHGHQPAHPEGPSLGGRNLCHEKHVWGGGQAVHAACQQLQPRRGRPELHSRDSRQGALHHRRRHVVGV